MALEFSSSSDPTAEWISNADPLGKRPRELVASDASGRGRTLRGQRGSSGNQPQSAAIKGSSGKQGILRGDHLQSWVNRGNHLEGAEKVQHAGEARARLRWTGGTGRVAHERGQITSRRGATERVVWRKVADGSEIERAKHNSTVKRSRAARGGGWLTSTCDAFPQMRSVAESSERQDSWKALSALSEAAATSANSTSLVR